MNLRKLYGHGKRPKQDTPGRGSPKNGSFRKRATGPEDGIPESIKGSLRSPTDASAILAMQKMLVTVPGRQKLRFNPNAVCKELVEFLKKDSGREAVKNSPGSRVVETAANALIEVLKKPGDVGTDSPLDTLAQNLDKRNARTPDVFMKIIPEMSIPAEIRMWAIDQLAKYSEVELGGKVDEIGLMLERLMVTEQTGPVRQRLLYRFGPQRGESPRVQGARRGERTVRIETRGPVGREVPSPRPATRKVELVESQAPLFRSPHPRDRAVAAKQLYDNAMLSRDKDVVKGILEMLEERRNEFPEECRDVLRKLKLLEERENSFRARHTIPPGPK